MVADNLRDIFGAAVCIETCDFPDPMPDQHYACRAVAAKQAEWTMALSLAHRLVEQLPFAEPGDEDTIGPPQSENPFHPWFAAKSVCHQKVYDNSKRYPWLGSYRYLLNRPRRLDGATLKIAERTTIEDGKATCVVWAQGTRWETA